MHYSRRYGAATAVATTTTNTITTSIIIIIIIIIITRWDNNIKMDLQEVGWEHGLGWSGSE